MFIILFIFALVEYELWGGFHNITNSFVERPRHKQCTVWFHSAEPPSVFQCSLGRRSQVAVIGQNF